MATRIEIYKDKALEWRWRLVHENGNIMAGSTEGYKNKADMVEALERIRGYMEHAIIKETE